MASDAARIRAEGAKVELTDGRIVAVRFDIAALMRIEDEFGSLAAAFRAEKHVSTVVRQLAIGLAHEGFTVDTLIPLLDSRRMHDYQEALGVAWQEALPDPDPKETGEATTESTGDGSGGSPQSSGDGPTASSSA